MVVSKGLLRVYYGVHLVANWAQKNKTGTIVQANQIAVFSHVTVAFRHLTGD